MQITVSLPALVLAALILGIVYLLGWRRGFARCEVLAEPALTRLARILTSGKVDE